MESKALAHPTKDVAPVSFVMPALNAARTISQSVQSILSGNFSAADELIIVNDGSTDGTQGILTKLQKRFPFIVIINNAKNIGCPASRNIGVTAAKNSLIFNLDADDLLVPNSRFALQQFLLQQNADVAAFGEIHYFVTHPKYPTHKWMCATGLISLADYLASYIVPGGNYLYTKKRWREVGGYAEDGKGLHEFWGFSLKQIASGSRFVVLPNSYYLHRYGQNSLYVRESRKSDTALVAFRMIEPYLDRLCSEDADYVRKTSTTGQWLSCLNERPLRLHSGEVGRPGNVVVQKYKRTPDYIFHAGVQRIRRRLAQ